MGGWDTPPTAEELSHSARGVPGRHGPVKILPVDPWTTPPTKEEMATANAAPQVDGAETFVNRAVNQIPLGNTLVNAVSSGLEQLNQPEPGVLLTAKAKAEMRARGIPFEEPPAEPGMLERYRGVRDSRLARTEAGAQQNPIAAKLGTTLGLATNLANPLAPVFKAGKAPALIQKVIAAGKTGMAYGGLGGLTDGRADLTKGEYGQALLDTGLGAGIGGLAGAGLGTAVELAAPYASKLLEKLGISAGRRVLNGGSDMNLAGKNPVSDEAVKVAREQGAIIANGTTAGTATRLATKSEEAGDLYAEILQKLEDAGVSGPEAKAISDKLLASAAEKELVTTAAGKKVPRALLSEALNVEGVAGGGQHPRLRLGQAELLKRDAQAAARSEYARQGPNIPLGDAKKEIASTYRQAVEDAIAEAASKAPKGSPIHQLAEDFLPVKRTTGGLIEARNAAKRGAAKKSNRNAFGLPEKTAIAQAAATLNPIEWVKAIVGASGHALLNDRVPSTIAAGTLDLARALQSGAATSGIARTVGHTEGRDASRDPHVINIVGEMTDEEKRYYDEHIKPMIEALRTKR